MNKTYKANKNHLFLKEGVGVKLILTMGWCMDCTGYGIHEQVSPENKPEWYDEVVETKWEEINLLDKKKYTSIELNGQKFVPAVEEPTVVEDKLENMYNDALDELFKYFEYKKPTVSEDEVQEIKKQICTIKKDGICDVYQLDIHKLATYLSKHISK